MELSYPRWRWLILCLLGCLAVAEFAARGPMRALGSGRDFNDFLSPYVQTHAWFSGRDPYAASTLRDLWPDIPRPDFVLKESANGALAAQRGIPSPYLTTAFPLLLPVAELPWGIAIWVWVFLCVLAVFVVATILSYMAGFRRYSQPALLIFLSALLFAPVHTAIAAANIFTISFAVGMLATFCLIRNHPTLAGILLTLAVALKPTVALPFVIYALASRNRAKVILPAVAMGGLLLSIAMIPSHGTTLWLKSFVANDDTMFAAGAIDDFSTANPLHFQLINLQTALFPLLQNRTLTQFGAILVFVVLLVLWFRAMRRNWQLDLLDLAILASVALLPVYHRFTDAGLLLVPVAWALSELQGNLRRFAAACLLLASPFLVPGATMLQEFSERSALVHNLSRSRSWDRFILPHQSWLILMICLVLLAAHHRTQSKLIYSGRKSRRVPGSTTSAGVGSGGM
jgi:glycosyl transferase family 87